MITLWTLFILHCGWNCHYQNVAYFETKANCEAAAKDLVQYASYKCVETVVLKNQEMPT